MNKKTEKFSFKSLIPMVLALLLIGLFIVPIPYYIEGPGTTENLKEFVTVDGKKVEGDKLKYKGAPVQPKVGIKKEGWQRESKSSDLRIRSQVLFI